MITTNRLKSALFVDFDNIYIGLKNLDESAAERFATNPAHWLNWLIVGMPTDENSEHERVQRDILIRRCYLNPRSMHRFRPFFIRSAFSVIDCPPLTAQDKNGADIHMVLDISDTLEHKTHFDEFIILSGDADFTPVLLRLRAHDRRTSILTVGPASDAYKAAGDNVISEDDFIEYGLGVDDSGFRTQSAPRPIAINGALDHVLDGMAAELYEEASANGEILAVDLPRLYRETPEFRRDSNWLGFYSLRSLTAELARRRPELRITEGDPWRVSVRIPRPAPPRSEGEEPPIAPPEAQEALRQAIAEHVRKMVDASDEPILMARAAHDVIGALGPQVVDSHWAGAGTFKDLLESVPNLGFEVATTPSPGYLFDPTRHELLLLSPEEEAESELPADLAPLAQKVYQITGTPRLTPQEYGVIFTAIADELRKNRYSLTGTSKAVRDLCIERGVAVSRSNISFVLKGIAYAGHRFHKRPEDDTAVALARVFRNSVLTRCQDAALELSPEERKQLDRWILGAFEMQ